MCEAHCFFVIEDRLHLVHNDVDGETVGWLLEG